MRLFIAVNFIDEIKNRILEVQARLRSQCVKGNFSRPENLHLTLAFLGETPEEKLDLLSAIIEELCSSLRPEPFEILFNHSGCFTHSHKELWWIGMEKNHAGFSRLAAIHGNLNALLSKAGFPVDSRPFNAHITLGREIKHNERIALSCPEITVKVERISLMNSEHDRGVLVYTEIMGRDLGHVN